MISSLDPLTAHDDLPSMRDALNEVQSKRLRAHLLLGNGFSLQAGMPFAMPIINHFATTYPLGARASQLLNNLPAIAPEDSLTYVTNFPALDPVTGERTSEYILLRQALVEGIIDAHPEHRYAVRRAMRTAAARLLNEFNSVFTTNYDLMAYWAMQEVLEPPPFADRFRPGHDRYSGAESVERFVAHTPPRTRAFWHLHGAIHLYQHKQRIAKVKVDRTESSVRDAIWSARDDGATPLIVLEGSSDRKKNAIERNRYLRRAFQELSRLRGVLFTFGFGFNWQDSHLTDAILSNRRLSAVWVGIYGDPNDVSNTELRYRIEERSSEVRHKNGRRQPDLSFYQADGVLRQLIG